jgi:tetratricopeptide (TPR) repeat protein
MTSGPSLYPHTAVELRFFRCFLVIGIFMVAVGDVSLAEKRPAWIEVRSPNFIVVTNANEQQGRRTAHEFEMIRAVFRDYFGQKGNSAEQPIMIIAAKDEGTLKALLPEFWAKRGSMHPAGVYLGAADASYIALRLDVSLNQQGDQPFEPIYHEYVHYLTRRLIAHLPLWMVEGLAEFYGNTRIESDKVFVGAPSTTNFVLLRETRLLPVSTLFDVDASSPYYHEESKTSIFYAESWALTHYLIARDWKDKTHRVSDFVELLEKGVDERQAAGRTIGDAGSLEPAVRNYIRSPSLSAKQMDPPKIDESGFQIRGVSDAESLSVRADFMAHDRHYSEAHAMLEEALKTDPKLGAACESMSFLSLQQGNVAEAEKWAAQAVALNPQSYRGNYYYAWSLLRCAPPDEESIAKAEARLRAVVKMNPTFAPAYDTLAYTLALPGSHQKLEEAYTMTLWAVESEPGNIHYRLRAVEVLERMGNADNAIRAATLAASMAKTPEERTAASAALAGAQQFQASQQKIKELHEVQKSGGVDGTTTGAVAGAGPEESAGQTPAGSSLPGVKVPVKASAEIEVLSDTQGVDFGPYVTKEVLPKLQVAWSRLAPAVAQSSVAKKKGKTVIEFAIQKDGSVVEMKLKGIVKRHNPRRGSTGRVESCDSVSGSSGSVQGKIRRLALQFVVQPGWCGRAAVSRGRLHSRIGGVFQKPCQPGLAKRLILWPPG